MIQVITTSKPLTRLAKLVLAMIIIAALGAGSVQIAAAQSQNPKKHHKLKVRMINPFYQGIAVKPSVITYFVNNNAVQATVNELQWNSWGGHRAEAVGKNDQGSEVPVTLSSLRRCGLASMRFYTRITVGSSTYPLQCRAQAISGVDIGKITESVSAFIPSEKRELYLPYRDASLMRGKWWHVGKPVAVGRGVTTSWWTFPEFRWVPSKVVLSKLGYCPQFGTIVYLKVRLVTYGNGIEAGEIPINRAARMLRKRVGKDSPEHKVQYNYRKWCKRKKYPEENWRGWE